MKVTLNVKLALIAGVINCIIWYLAARSLNYYSFDIDRYRYYATLLLLLVGIFISIYFARKSNGGYIDFKPAMKTGFLYTVILALVLAIFNYLYYSFIAPDVVDFFAAEAKKAMTEQKLPEADIAKNLELVRSYFGSFRMFMSTMIMGVLLCILGAAVLRRKNPLPDFGAN